MSEERLIDLAVCFLLFVVAFFCGSGDEKRR